MKAEDHSTFVAGDESICIDDVAAIAKEAGEAIMKVYETASLESKAKDDGSPLTIADTQANDIICRRLLELYPSIPILSEENDHQSYSERSRWRYFWCVDPLDGTKEFLKRNGQFTVNIGLCEGHRPIAGVVYVPVTSITYKGVSGLGPPVREGALGHDSRESIICEEFDETDSELRIVASASHNTPETEKFIARYDQPRVKSYGSSLKLLMVADGSAHVYPRMAPTMEWDTCAAHAIVECAGGEVLQYPSGEPLVYNKNDLRNPSFVVYGKRRRRESTEKRDINP